MDSNDLDNILNSAIKQFDNESHNNKEVLIKQAKKEIKYLFEEFEKIFYEAYPQFSELKLNLFITYE